MAHNCTRYRGTTERRAGHTFAADREMSLERVPSDCCILITRAVDEVPRVVAGKVLDCAVCLYSCATQQTPNVYEYELLNLSGERCGGTNLVPSKRRPPYFERVRDDRVHDHLAGNIHDSRHFEVFSLQSVVLGITSQVRRLVENVSQEQVQAQALAQRALPDSRLPIHTQSKGVLWASSRSVHRLQCN